jgi:phosphatidylserine/phosphatidylglycerophosphate/cardiolipin synthase-like enzyme
LIDGATHTLDVAMFFFTSRPVAAAIVAAKQRGVTIRMILDGGGAGNHHSGHLQLCHNGIPVKVEHWGGKAHAKWAVADAASDDAAVVFGSMNWTESGDQDNDENTLYVRNKAFAQPFASEFNRQWTDLADVTPCAD